MSNQVPSQEEIEFAEWSTPFVSGYLTILEVLYGNGELDIEFSSEKVAFRKSASHLVDAYSLHVRVFHKESCSIYKLEFSQPGAFRVLDEHGLCEIWSASKNLGGIPGDNSFKVRGHSWSRESPLSFHHYSKNGWSYMLATEDDCLEVITTIPPIISLEEVLPPIPVAD